MWSIIPDEIVEANFGKRVRKHFLGIEVHIGNKSSQSFLVEGMVFKSPTGQTLPVMGLTAVFPLAKHREDRNLCRMVFDGELLVRTNHQIITFVFLPRAIIKNPIMRTADDARTLRNEIGDLEVTVSKVAEEKVILRTTSQIQPD